MKQLVQNLPNLQTILFKHKEKIAEANHYKPLDRVVITRDVNEVMREVSNQLPGKLNIISHSFQISYITQLWKDSKDIEFVKQTIGYRNLDTTFAYVN